MKGLFLFISIMFSCTFLFSINNTMSLSNDRFQDTFPASALSSIETGFLEFIQKIPVGKMSDYGFSNDQELAKAELGTPFRLYTIKPESVINHKKNISVDQILIKTSQWYFPILVDKSIHAMLVVEESSNRGFKPVSFGYVPLAENLNKAFALKDWELANTPKLVVIYQAKEFFLANPVSHPDRLFPLQIDYAAVKRVNDDLFSNLTRIRTTVDNNMMGGF
jgi:hypothetical protein